MTLEDIIELAAEQGLCEEWPVWDGVCRCA
jgi:hypothetical protein